jgi:hypothetical protein
MADENQPGHELLMPTTRNLFVLAVLPLLLVLGSCGKNSLFIRPFRPGSP